jgi:hypothetical protein
MGIRKYVIFAGRFSLPNRMIWACYALAANVLCGNIKGRNQAAAVECIIPAGQRISFIFDISLDLQIKSMNTQATPPYGATEMWYRVRQLFRFLIPGEQLRAS